MTHIETAPNAVQKSPAGVSLYSRFVNRPMGRALAVVLTRAGWSPDAVTLLSAAVSGTGIVVIAAAPVRPWAGLAAAALLVVGFALDSADGQVARMSGRSSLRGEWLDHVVDAVKMVAVHGAVLVGLYRAGDVALEWLLVPLGFQLVATATFAGGLISDLLLRAGAPSGKRQGNPRRASTLRSLVLLPADYGILCLVFVLWAWPAAFLTAYAVLLACCMLIMAALLARWSRALSKSGAQR